MGEKTIELEQLMSDSRIGDMIQLRELLSEESDRGSVLLAVSYLENELENALRLVLVEDKLCDKVFRGILGNFASKINMSYLLGIISKEQMNNINKIKDVRNKFGHSYTKLEFDTDEIKRACLDLRYQYEEYIDDATTRDIFFKNVDKEISSIIKAGKTIKRIDEKKDEYSTDEFDIKIEASKEDFYLFLSEIFKELDKYSSKKYYAKMLASDKVMDVFYKYYCESSNEI